MSFTNNLYRGHDLFDISFYLQDRFLIFLILPCNMITEHTTPVDWH